MRYEGFKRILALPQLVFAKRAGLLCVVSFSFVATAAEARYSRSIDDILSAEKRICGMLTQPGDSMGRTFVLTSDASLLFGLNGPSVVMEHFSLITLKYPSGIYICVPADSNTIPSQNEPLIVEWFAYIDPGSSGISVVNQ